MHIGIGICERDGVRPGAAAEIEDAANPRCAKGLHHQGGTLFGVALHSGDKVAGPFGSMVAGVIAKIDGDAGATAHGIGQCAPAMPDVGYVQQTRAVRLSLEPWTKKRADSGVFV